MKNKSKYACPPADIILDIINDENDAPEKVLGFYNEYAEKSAKEPVYNGNGKIVTTIINDDLLQNIREDIIKAIPILRRSILNGNFSYRPLVVIVAAGKEILE